MFLTDPTLYGATLPSREIPFPAPFFSPFLGQNMPMQNAPWQMQSFPWQNAALQNVPWQSFQRFVPPYFQHGVPPYFTQSLGYTQPMTASSPTTFNPYIQSGFFNLPQRSWTY